MPLYAFGSNGSGQLGVGHIEDLSMPTRCLFDKEEDEGQRNENENENDKVAQIVAGGNHTLVLFVSGAAYAAGSNGSGRCVQGSEGEDMLVRRFRRVVICEEEEEDDDDNGNRENGKRRIDRFSSVSATWEASFLVDSETSAVYAVGAGAKGELGLGSNVTESRVPVRIPDFPPAGKRVVAISSSGWHTVAVLSNGELYGWGNARKGQLGKAGVQNKIYWSPTKIGDMGFPASQAACGREFTVVAGDTADGSLVVLGSDKWGVQTAAPQSVNGHSTVSTGWNGIVVHNSDGSVVSWGRNDRGQLPPHDTPKLAKLAIGSEHAVGVVDSGKLVACGWGEHGNCGPTTDAQGNVKGQWADIPFSLAEGENIVKLGAGCATSWVVTG